MGAEKVFCAALDVENLDQAMALATQVSPHAGYLKLGRELTDAEGMPQCIAALQSFKRGLFVDAKLHDIPRTVGRSTAAIAQYGVQFITVHASAGVEAMRAAVSARGSAKILAVTVLTSLDNKTCKRIYGTEVPQKVLQFAEDALESGVDGLVCSGVEVQFLRSIPKFPKLFLATPGTRPSWYIGQDDQIRTMTPSAAMRAGADMLIAGRPLINPPEKIGGPAEAARLIVEEIQSARRPQVF